MALLAASRVTSLLNLACAACAVAKLVLALSAKTPKLSCRPAKDGSAALKIEIVKGAKAAIINAGNFCKS